MRQVRLSLGAAALVGNLVVAIGWPEGSWQGLVRSALLSGFGAFIVQEACYEYRRDRRNRRDTRSDFGAGLHAGIAKLAADTIGAVPAAESPSTRVGDEPIRATKRAHLDHATGQFRGIGHSEHPYGVEAVAVCGQGHDHHVPDDKCSCGFYALDTNPASMDSVYERQMYEMQGNCTLEVELYGKVIRGKHGYRAEKQRILSVTVDRTCQHADHFFNGGGMGAMRMPVPAPYRLFDGTLLCAQHALGQKHRFTEWSSADLANLIGTEVR